MLQGMQCFHSVCRIPAYLAGLSQLHVALTGSRAFGYLYHQSCSNLPLARQSETALAASYFFLIFDHTSEVRLPSN